MYSKSLICIFTSLGSMLMVQASPLSTRNIAKYAPGWCGMHIVQYQKNVPDVPHHPANAEYMVEVSLFDANQAPIPITNCNGCKFIATSVALNGEANYIESYLPWGMEITVGATDSDAILFAYGDQNWGSNDQPHHSNFGGYDGGMRIGDTGFSC